MRSLLIEYNCPQCAGPVTLEETDRLLICDFCRARLYFTYEDYFRYFLPPSSQLVEETIFIPYWRFRGIYFSLEPFEVKEKFLDTSFLASENISMPDSLGLRTQTQKLKLASQGMKGHFVHPDTSIDEVISKVEQVSQFRGRDQDSGKIFHKAFIGDVTSMIYSPIYIKDDKVYDAILDRPIAKEASLMSHVLRFSGTRQNWNIEFVSAMCPDCGWDLEGERDSVVLFCRNCSSAWQLLKGSLKRLDFRIVTHSEKDAVYIPFWRMEADIHGIQARSYADLMRLGNLPKAIEKEWEEKQLHLWSPAFRTNPRLFLRLTKQLTLLQPHKEAKETFDGSNLCSATLPLSEALESAKIILANISIPKKKIFPLLPSTDIKPKNSLLVYLPFAVRGNEFIQMQMKFSIQRNAIRQKIPTLIS